VADGREERATTNERPLDEHTRIHLRAMAVGDIPGAVGVHLSAFQGFFLSFLGPKFLTHFYAEAVRLGEIALVADAGEKLIGFVMGSIRPDRFYEQLLRRGALRFAWAAAPAVLRRPTAVVRIARALGKPREARRPTGTATLMSLAVAPMAQGIGAGRKLVEAFLSEARLRGARKVDLTTDKTDNARTNGFYTSAGFRSAREIVTREGRVLVEYERDLPP
jgi:ribosomal protein S18 acetylase RimI-like enzyme